MLTFPLYLSRHGHDAGLERQHCTRGAIWPGEARHWAGPYDSVVKVGVTALSGVGARSRLASGLGPRGLDDGQTAILRKKNGEFRRNIFGCV